MPVYSASDDARRPCFSRWLGIGTLTFGDRTAAPCADRSASRTSWATLPARWTSSCSSTECRLLGRDRGRLDRRRHPRWCRPAGRAPPRVRRSPAWPCSRWSPIAAILTVGPSILAALHGGGTMGPDGRRGRPRRVHAVRHLGTSRARTVVERRPAGGDGLRGLRTDGPYAITRHPIYTGLLGMLLGTALLGGLGQWMRARRRWTGRRRAQDPVRGASPPRDVPRRLCRLPRTRARR